MPAYEICYLDGQGALTGKILALCDSEVKAKVLAHAMKLDGSKRIEVWQDKTLVYERPRTMQETMQAVL